MIEIDLPNLSDFEANQIMGMIIHRFINEDDEVESGIYALKVNMLNKVLGTYGSTLKDIFVSNEDYYDLYDDIIPRKLSSVYNRITLIEAADIYKYLKHGIEFDGMKNWTSSSKVSKSTGKS